jgi:hypothetical protein
MNNINTRNSLNIHTTFTSTPSSNLNNIFNIYKEYKNVSIDNTNNNCIEYLFILYFIILSINEIYENKYLKLYLELDDNDNDTELKYELIDDIIETINVDMKKMYKNTDIQKKKIEYMNDIKNIFIKDKDEQNQLNSNIKLENSNKSKENKEFEKEINTINTKLRTAELIDTDFQNQLINTLSIGTNDKSRYRQFDIFMQKLISKINNLIRTVRYTVPPMITSLPLYVSGGLLPSMSATNYDVRLYIALYDSIKDPSYHITLQEFNKDINNSMPSFYTTLKTQFKKNSISFTGNNIFEEINNMYTILQNNISELNSELKNKQILYINNTINKYKKEIKLSKKQNYEKIVTKIDEFIKSNSSNVDDKIDIKNNYKEAFNSINETTKLFNTTIDKIELKYSLNKLFFVFKKNSKIQEIKKKITDIDLDNLDNLDNIIVLLYNYFIEKNSTESFNKMLFKIDNSNKIMELIPIFDEFSKYNKYLCEKIKLLIHNINKYNMKICLNKYMINTFFDIIKKKLNKINIIYKKCKSEKNKKEGKIKYIIPYTNVIYMYFIILLIIIDFLIHFYDYDNECNIQYLIKKNNLNNNNNNILLINDNDNGHSHRYSFITNMNNINILQNLKVHYNKKVYKYDQMNYVIEHDITQRVIVYLCFEINDILHFLLINGNAIHRTVPKYYTIFNIVEPYENYLEASIRTVYDKLKYNLILDYKNIRYIGILKEKRHKTKLTHNKIFYIILQKKPKVNMIINDKISWLNMEEIHRLKDEIYDYDYLNEIQNIVKDL